LPENVTDAWQLGFVAGTNESAEQQCFCVLAGQVVMQAVQCIMYTQAFTLLLLRCLRLRDRPTYQQSCGLALHIQGSSMPDQHCCE
jgi:hypothetical protein